jgi:integrase/recombinase XerC
MKDLKILENNEVLNFEDLKNQFIQYIDVSEKTVESYSGSIKQFLVYMQDNDIKNPTRQDIINFREYIKSKSELNTVNSYMIALRSFFNFLEYMGIYKNITENVKGVKIEQYHKREYLTLEQCQNVLSNAKNLREKTLFTITFTCGLRANEVVNIRLSDFTIKGGKHCLYVLGKDRDGKQDYVVVSDSTYNLIQKYIIEYNITDYLFVSESNHNKGGKLSTCTLRRIINKMYERVGIIGKEYVFHSLRHSFATLSLQNGVDMREVSKGMRHKNIATTEIYAHDLEKINNKCSNVVSDMLLGGM